MIHAYIAEGGKGNASVFTQLLKCVISKCTLTLCAELHSIAHSASSSMIKTEEQKTDSEPCYHLQCNVRGA